MGSSGGFQGICSIEVASSQIRTRPFCVLGLFLLARAWPTSSVCLIPKLLSPFEFRAVLIWFLFFRYERHLYRPEYSQRCAKRAQKEGSRTHPPRSPWRGDFFSRGR